MYNTQKIKNKKTIFNTISLNNNFIVVFRKIKRVKLN